MTLPTLMRSTCIGHQKVTKPVQLDLGFVHRSMEVKLPALLGDYDRQIDRPSKQPTDGQTGAKGSFTSNTFTGEGWVAVNLNLTLIFWNTLYLTQIL